MFCVKDRVVLVTGGAKGIGAMITEGMHKAGARVIITGRDGNALDRMCNRLPGLKAIKADLSKESEIKDLVSKLSNETNTCLHVLINNAGANWGAPLNKYPDEAFEKVLNLNVKKVFMLIRLLEPVLAKSATPERPSTIINVGSIDGIRVPLLETYAYSASKAALHHMTRVLAANLAAKHILVNAIAPGPFESKMMADTLSKFKDVIVQGVPVGRIGKPSDMSAICIFLASTGASYITGSVIPVDGGILIKASL